ncbi:MAG: peptide ABC transporter substrate-binding protein [Stackebrandtia sp.]
MRYAKRLTAVAAVAALAVAGCGGGGGSGGEEELGTGTLRLGMPGGGPPHLSPFGSADTSSSSIVQKINVGLVEYAPESSEAENVIAESFESEDNVTWEVKIQEGWKFHNGEEITAQTFVDSWNFTANAENAPDNTYFFTRFAGYEELNEGKDVTELSGLKVVDDTTFTVELNAPWLAFPTALGYAAYFPLAEACMADAEKCDQEAPIGNGPMLYPEGEVDKDVQIELKRWDDYKGTKPQVDTVIYTVYTDENALWADFQAGELDLATAPDAEWEGASASMPDQLKEAVSASFTYLGFPIYDEKFADAKIRQAFSLAINRDTMRDAAFNGRHRSADSFTPPEVIPGGVEGTCNYCATDEDEAKKLFDEAGGDELFTDTLKLYANSGVGHEDWLEAVGNDLERVLGIEYKIELVEWEDYLELTNEQNFEGPFRLGWAPDYPANENYLTGVYGHGADNNNFGYEGEEFNELLAEGDSAESLDDALGIYQDAERILGEDMPCAPLFFSDAHTFISTNVDPETVVYGALNGWNWDLVKVNS